MITRDFLMRQIYQLTQVLVRVLLKKAEKQPEDAYALIEEAEREVPALGALTATDLGRDAVLDACRQGHRLNADLAVAAADVLREKADLVPQAGLAYRRYALWLYEGAVATPGATLPMDVHDRITALRASLHE